MAEPINDRYLAGRIQNLEETFLSWVGEITRQVAGSERNFKELVEVHVLGFRVKQELCQRQMNSTEVESEREFLRGKRDGSIYLAETLLTVKYRDDLSA